MQIKDFIQTNHLFLDGAMGTMLQQAGLPLGQMPETLNLSNPQKILAVHQAFVAAGSDLVLTCTFGANRKKLAGTGCSVAEVVTAAVRNAKASGAPFIGLDVGPIGELLQPTGSLSFDEAYDIFAEMIDACEEQVDVIYIETMTDLLECKAALLAAKEHSSLPVFCTMSFEENHRTFLGVPPEAAALTLEGLGADAIGINCSLGPVQIFPIAQKMAAYASIPLIIKPNAGLPRVEHGVFCYDITPEEFAQSLRSYADIGFTIFGGCCGTTPDYIRRTKAALADVSFAPNPPKNRAAVCSSVSVIDADQVRVIGERINPTGKKRFREALRQHDMDYIIQQATSQIDAGADILDVNVGTPEIDEKAMMLDVLNELQGVVDCPLQIDSSDPAVVESALRVYSGVPIVNSVNGEEKSLVSILPLVKKYGALVVGLTLDENGIPDTAEGRFAIAEKIVKRAAEYGIPSNHILIDCLTLTVSAEPTGAVETLKALKMVKEKLGVKSVLGVSNISFGLPGREHINAQFLSLALAAGLDFPIINPNASAMMDAVYTHNLLFCQDPGGERYIARFAGDIPAAGAPAAADSLTIGDAVLKGLAGECGSLTKALLETVAPLSIISEYLIPALDVVGDRYEAGKLFLPQLIRAAEAAKAGFAVIRDALPPDQNTGQTDSIILATVKGDIHDIGKNIVKVVMENYGYHIIDLGRDVPPETIADAAIQRRCAMVGLSALMTTTLKSMEDTISLLKARGYPGKIFVGGAVVTEEYALSIGADFYAKDAKSSVDIAKQVL